MGNTLDKLTHLVYNDAQFTVSDKVKVQRGNGTTRSFSRIAAVYAAWVKG
jgi:hypothetical protein